VLLLPHNHLSASTHICWFVVFPADMHTSCPQADSGANSQQQPTQRLTLAPLSPYFSEGPESLISTARILHLGTSHNQLTWWVESSQAEATLRTEPHAVSTDLRPSCACVAPASPYVDESWLSSALDVEPGSPRSCGWSLVTIGDNGKPDSRLEGDEVVSEARMYDRYWTQATTIPAKASMVARQPKMMVKVSSLSLEFADMLEVWLVWYELGWYELRFYAL
jgi:hypothetical protein